MTDALIAIGRLTDHFAVAQLLDRYARLLDDRTFTATLPALFTIDAEVSLPAGDHRGIDGMDTYHDGVLSTFGRTQHIFTNYLIDLAEDHATLRANAHATHHLRPVDRSDNLFIAGGVITATAVRAPDGWRIQRLAVDAVWRQGDFMAG